MATIASRQPSLSNEPSSQLRRDSATGPSTVQTRSLGYGIGVYHTRTKPLTDDDIQIVLVRLSKKQQPNSSDALPDLPSRPRPRSFLRRVSTRLSRNGGEDDPQYKAVKMPRREYLRHFRRDEHGNYAGTEPEQEWDETELMEKYAEYQSIPIEQIMS